MAEFLRVTRPWKKAKKSSVCFVPMISMLTLVCANSELKSSQPFDLSGIEGTYSNCAPDIKDHQSDIYYPFTLGLALSSTRSHIWGTFDFGFEGKLRSRTPLATSKGIVEFHWRDRDSAGGTSTFGEKNVAHFNFCG